MLHLNAQITTQAIISNSKEEVLLVKRNKKNGWFTLPGGTIQQGEKIKDGLEREVFEETGLKVKVGKPAWVWQSDHIGKDLVGVVFVCDSRIKPEEKIHLSSEHNKYLWIKINDLYSRDDVDPYIKTKEFRLWKESNGII